MNILIEVLIKEIISGIHLRLDSREYEFGKENEKILRDTLYRELTKPSIEQSKTPTQIVNDFLQKEFNESFTLTPANFGEKAHQLIMEWGIQKAKDISEKKDDQ